MISACDILLCAPTVVTSDLNVYVYIGKKSASEYVSYSYITHHPFLYDRYLIAVCSHICGLFRDQHLILNRETLMYLPQRPSRTSIVCPALPSARPCQNPPTVFDGVPPLRH